MTIDDVRATIYRGFADTGRAPSVAAIAERLGAGQEGEDEIGAHVRELANRHVLVLTPDGRAIERALPFAGVPTGFEVRAGSRTWSVNCVWDALALPPLLGIAADIHTTCADCGDAVTVRVDPVTGPDRPDLVAHFLLPAARWYDDVRYT